MQLLLHFCALERTLSSSLCVWVSRDQPTVPCLTKDYTVAQISTLSYITDALDHGCEKLQHFSGFIFFYFHTR